MYKYILETAGNINWMALLALSTFFIVFVMSAIMAFSKDKKELNALSNMPLSDDDPIFK